MPMVLRNRRDSEAARDSPTTPSAVMICSPTPRRGFFNVPERHNLDDSPRSTPSVSPVQFDLTPATYKERLSAPKSRASKKGKGDEGYIKRPENAFILFRRDMCHKINAAKAEGSKPNREADLSKTISQQWRTLPDDERQKWKDLAEQKKQEHKAEFPHYKYRPQRNGKNKKHVLSEEEEGEEEQDPDAEYRPSRSERGVSRSRERTEHSRDVRISLAPPQMPSRPASAPNESSYLLYQELYVPNMHLAPSCPNSPMPMPRSLPSFDYLGNERVDGGYEGGFPQFYPDIFNMAPSAYGSTPASSCPSSPIMGAYNSFTDPANIDPRLLEAEMDLESHLRNDMTIENEMYTWGEMEDIMTNADFDISRLVPAQPMPCSIANLLNDDRT